MSGEEIYQQVLADCRKRIKAATEYYPWDDAEPMERDEPEDAQDYDCGPFVPYHW